MSANSKGGPRKARSVDRYGRGGVKLRPTNPQPRTLAKLAVYLDFLRKGYSKGRAADEAKINYKHMQAIRQRNAEFKEMEERAVERGTDFLEDQARKRAVHAKKPSDLLMIFLLKARRPEKYRDRYEVKQTKELSIRDASEDMILSLADAIQASREAHLTLGEGGPVLKVLTPEEAEQTV